MTDRELRLLEAEGWTVECESPLEIRKMEGGESAGFAAGVAAHMVLAFLGEGFPPKQERAESDFVDDVVKGIVRKWFSEKGYGFVVPDGGKKDVFVHQSKIEMDGFRKLDENQRVEFKMGTGTNGRPAAEWVRPL